MTTRAAQKVAIATTYFLPLILFAACLIHSISNQESLVYYFVNYSYYLVFLLVIVWGATLLLYLKSRNFSSQIFLKRYWPGLLASLLLTAFAFLSVKPELRVLSDEANMLSVSRTLLMEKRAYNTTMGLRYYGNLNPVTQVVPKRPLLFPFLTQLIHTVFGFQLQNVFILNAIILFSLLFTVFLVAQHFSDLPTSLAITFLVAAYPVFSITATSGSFDLLATLFYLLIAVSLYAYLKAPSGIGFALLWANLLMYANIRYESFLFFFLVLGLLVLLKAIKLEILKKSLPILAITPILGLPLVLQKLFLVGKYEHPEGTSLFSVSQFLDNLQLFLKGETSFNFFLPYANIVNLAGILVFAYVLSLLLRRKVTLRERSHRQFFMILLAMVGATYVIFLSLFIGKHDNPTAARYFLIFSILCSFSPLALKLAKPNLVPGKALVLLSVLAYFLYHPIALGNRFMNSLLLTREARHSYQFLEKSNTDNLLIVSDRPVLFTALGYGAVSFEYANYNAKNILNNLNRNLYSDVVVFQRINYGTERQIVGHGLRSTYKLYPVREVQVSGVEYLRISKVHSTAHPRALSE